MFYDMFTKASTSAEYLRLRGLPVDKPEELASLGIYRVIEEIVPFNPEKEGLEPDGGPVACGNLPFALVQPMRKVNLLARFQKEKLATLASTRWERQVLGVYVAGIFVDTCPENLQKLASAIAGMETGSKKATAYKARGSWLGLTLYGMKDLYGQASEYVEACFLREYGLASEIMAADSITALNDININAGWPDTESQV